MNVPLVLAAQGQPDSEPSDVSGETPVSVEMSEAWSTVNGMVDGFVSLLPKLAIAAVALVVFIIIAWIVRSLIQKYVTSHPSASLGRVIGRLAQWGIILAGVMVAVAIVAPSVTPAKLLSALGIGGVAIGFAFKDILQNFLAGILILLRQPFSVGDQAVFGDFEGTVESIDTRSTVLKTYDGRRVLIPNGSVYTNPMVIKTAYDARRSQYDVGIGYGDDIGAACKAILEVLENHDEVKSDPAPDVLVSELAGSSVNLRCRWWTDPRRSDVVLVASEIRRAIKDRLDNESIDMPYPTRVVLLHDQTEETDGDRKRQREGWPVGENPPEPRKIATAVANSNNGQ